MSEINSFSDYASLLSRKSSIEKAGISTVPKYRSSFVYYDESVISWHSKEEVE